MRRYLLTPKRPNPVLSLLSDPLFWVAVAVFLILLFAFSLTDSTG